VTGLKQALVRTFTVLLLPISLLPIYFALPRLKAEFGQAAEHVDRGALAPENVAFSAAENARWSSFPDYRNSIPVLVYHGINDRNDVYSISRRSFAAQMQMLDRAGFDSISMEQYVRFLGGDKQDLPDRPVLITFDDGRLDSYRGADLVLARHGFRATMFVIASAAEADDNFYLNWDELNRMADSGRWDIQEHAGDGHRNVTFDAKGGSGPFYAFRRYGKQDGLESFSSYQRRVVADVIEGRRLLEKNVPSYRPLAFALPYGDFGQNETNDARIPKFFNAFLRRYFAAVFVVKPAGFTTADTHRGQIGRYEVRTYTTARRLFNWLHDGVPVRPGEVQLASWCRRGWTCAPAQSEGKQRSGAGDEAAAVPVSEGDLPTTSQPQFVSTRPVSRPAPVTQAPRRQPQSAPAQPRRQSTQPKQRKRVTLPKPSSPAPAVEPSAPIDALEELPAVP
jgi:peptidoglycan/xylan/chitin deacetylase (PgdA/CDA1 family)